MQHLFRGRVALGLAALAVGLIASSGPAVAAASASSAGGVQMTRTLLRDGFQNANRSEWTFHNRAGEIRDGRLWIDGGYVGDSAGRSGWALAHAGDQTWTDYSYDVTYNNDIGGEPSDIRQVDIFFRVASTLPASDPRQFGTMYRLEIWDPGTPSPKLTSACAPGLGSPLPGGLVTLIKYVDGDATQLTEACTSNSQNGTNAVRVQVLGGAIDVAVNGQAVLHFVDPAPITFGGVGVEKIWETNGWFDDVRVRAIKERSVK
jgi:hypothetical protein